MKTISRYIMTLALLLTAVTGAWAADTEVSPEGGSSNADVKGTSFTIDGTFNAGSGIKLANMQTKGIKIRTNRADNTLKIAVNDGYTINALTIYAASNDNSKTVTITGITVDGTAYSGPSYPVTLAQRNAETTTTINVTGISATDNITLSFGGTNLLGIIELHVDYTSNAALPNINAEDASITATESGVEVTKDIDVTGANLTGSTLTATLSPAVSGLSVTLASNTITGGAISTKATLHYTATESASGSTTLTLSDGTTAKAVTVNYSANAKTIKVTTNAASEQDLFTEASFKMPTFDVDVNYTLVRDMQDEANPVAFSGLPSSGNIVVKKGDDGKYQPAEALNLQLIDPLAAADAQNIIAADGITIKVLVGNGGTPIEYDQDNPITLEAFLADMKPGYYWIKAEQTDENSPYDGTVYSSEFTAVEQYDLTVKPANDFSKGKIESVTVGSGSVTIDANTGEATKTGITPDTEVKLKAKHGYIIEKVEAKKKATK